MKYIFFKELLCMQNCIDIVFQNCDQKIAKM